MKKAPKLVLFWLIVGGFRGWAHYLLEMSPTRLIHIDRTSQMNNQSSKQLVKTSFEFDMICEIQASHAISYLHPKMN
jgi:hypothetical protein